MPPPAMLSYQWLQSNVVLNWDMPDPGNGQLADLTGYNIYHQPPGEDPEFVDLTQETSFVHQADFAAGIHNYYVTAIYDGDESSASNIVSIDFLTPAPSGLEGLLLNDMIELSWNLPDASNEPMANLEGYTIYHKPENGTFELLAFVEDNYYVHEVLESTGTQTYFANAVYTGGASTPSDEIEILYYITGIADDLNLTTSIFPNPATDFLTITSEHTLRKVNIINQAGQIIKSDRIDERAYRLDVRNLQAGLYILMIETVDGSSSERIVIK
jgi:hypothetical protein